MCGRFTLRTPAAELVDFFELADPPAGVLGPPRYNIAPTQPIAIVRCLEPAGPRRLALARWGLVPAWSKEVRSSAPMINARAETAAEKPSFRSALRRRRCLIPTDGFYEWRAEGKKKQPLYIRMRDGRPFAFAGLWERWTGADGAEIESCAVLTTAANALMRTIHDRMPVILPPGRYGDWLTPAERTPTMLAELLVPYDPDLMDATLVGTRVNNVKNDDADCLTPLE